MLGVPCCVAAASKCEAPLDDNKLEDLLVDDSGGEIQVGVSMRARILCLIHTRSAAVAYISREKHMWSAIASWDFFDLQFKKAGL